MAKFRPNWSRWKNSVPVVCQKCVLLAVAWQPIYIKSCFHQYFRQHKRRSTFLWTRTSHEGLMWRWFHQLNRLPKIVWSQRRYDWVVDGFVCAYHLAAPCSSPKYTIYAFIIFSQICAIFVMRVWPISKTEQWLWFRWQSGCSQHRRSTVRIQSLSKFAKKNLQASLFLNQCDQIGRFLKVLGNKFALKSIPKRLLSFGIFWKRSINVNGWCGYYVGNFWKHLGNFWKHLSNFWKHLVNFFNQASCHTFLNSKVTQLHFIEKIWLNEKEAGLHKQKFVLFF